MHRTALFALIYSLCQMASARLRELSLSYYCIITYASYSLNQKGWFQIKTFIFLHFYSRCLPPALPFKRHCKPYKAISAALSALTSPSLHPSAGDLHLRRLGCSILSVPFTVWWSWGKPVVIQTGHSRLSFYYTLCYRGHSHPRCVFVTETVCVFFIGG